MNHDSVSPDSALQVWYVLTIATMPDHADTLSDWVREELQVEPVQLERPGAIQCWLECYFDSEDAARIAAPVVETQEGVMATAVRRCDSRDWHTFWRTHFKPHNIGERLRICPVWEQDAELPSGRVTLHMVPGLSFGTGEHFTTRFCLEMIDRLTGQGAECRTMWDVGCGSGILAVAGALLGVKSVLGTDNDPICLVQAAENAALNGVSDRAQWATADILVPGDPVTRGPFDLVCANLFASLVQQAAVALWSATGRYLALSGIREFEVDGVADAFVQLGAREIVRDGDGDWAGLLFEKKQPAP